MATPSRRGLQVAIPCCTSLCFLFACSRSFSSYPLAFCFLPCRSISRRSYYTPGQQSRPEYSCVCRFPGLSWGCRLLGATGWQLYDAVPGLYRSIVIDKRGGGSTPVPFRPPIQEANGFLDLRWATSTQPRPTLHREFLLWSRDTRSAWLRGLGHSGSRDIPSQAGARVCVGYSDPHSLLVLAFFFVLSPARSHGTFRHCPSSRRSRRSYYLCPRIAR